MSGEESKSAPLILGFGNPLLDISAEVPASLLEKYGVTLNNAILAEEKHKPVYKELVDSYEPDYIAGGATQNSIRVAQWILGDAGKTAFVGCIGDDDFGKQLATAASNDGVDARYLIDAETPTGTCAVLVNDTERSLIANLAAANNYKISHLETPAVQEVLAAASIVYSSGFFLTVSPDSMVAAGKHCAENNKVYALNLAAPFIPAVFATPMAEVLAYANFVFGNESEGAAYAEANGMAGAPLTEVAVAIARLPLANGYRCRTVVITQGGDDIIVATNGTVKTYPVEKLPKSAIVDANGAGDAFVGGFLAKLALGEDLDTCVASGSKAATVILGRSGCTFPKSA